MEGTHEAHVSRRELRFSGGAGHLATNQVVGDQGAPDFLAYPIDGSATQGQLHAEHRLLQFPVARFDLPAPLVTGDDVSRFEASAIEQRRQQNSATSACIDRSDCPRLPELRQRRTLLACLRRDTHAYRGVLGRPGRHLPARVGLGRNQEVAVVPAHRQTAQDLGSQEAFVEYRQRIIRYLRQQAFGVHHLIAVIATEAGTCHQVRGDRSQRHHAHLRIAGDPASVSLGAKVLAVGRAVGCA
ncbi:hypothetical protein D9M68_657060 [compost metagenome]